MTGPVKTSPSGKFSCPSQLIQVIPRHAHAHVRAVGGDDAIFLLADEEVHQLLLALGDGFPCRDRIRTVQEPRAVDEVFVPPPGSFPRPAQPPAWGIACPPT